MSPTDHPLRPYACGWPGISAGRMRKPPSSTSARSKPRLLTRTTIARTCTSLPFRRRYCGPRITSQMRWSAGPDGRRSSNGATCSPLPSPSSCRPGTAGKTGRPGKPPGSTPILARPPPSGPPSCVLSQPTSRQPSWNDSCWETSTAPTAANSSTTRRPDTRQCALGPAPRRHHQPARRHIRPASQSRIPDRGHTTERHHHLQPRPAPRRPRWLTHNPASPPGVPRPGCHPAAGHLDKAINQGRLRARGAEARIRTFYSQVRWPPCPLATVL